LVSGSSTMMCRQAGGRSASGSTSAGWPSGRRRSPCWAKRPSLQACPGASRSSNCGTRGVPQRQWTVTSTDAGGREKAPGLHRVVVSGS
jgi:hypothetical protein